MKTPEELAEEYAKDWHKDCDYPEAILKHTKKATETVFLAGYKAAQEQICNATKQLAQHQKRLENVLDKIKNANIWMINEELEATGCKLLTPPKEAK